MAKVLAIDPEKCTSCRLCELVCSERNRGSYRPSRSHIQVLILPEEAVYFPMVCVQCDEAPCISACPTEALVREADTNVVVLVADRCDECGVCESACPYGVIRCLDGLARKCELCGGDPECVKFCSPGALRFEEAEQWSAPAREAYTNHLLELQEEAKP